MCDVQFIKVNLIPEFLVNLWEPTSKKYTQINSKCLHSQNSYFHRTYLYCAAHIFFSKVQKSYSKQHF